MYFDGRARRRWKMRGSGQLRGVLASCQVLEAVNKERHLKWGGDLLRWILSRSSCENFGPSFLTGSGWEAVASRVSSSEDISENLQR